MKEKERGENETEKKITYQVEKKERRKKKVPKQESNPRPLNLPLAISYRLRDCLHSLPQSYRLRD